MAQSQADKPVRVLGGEVEIFVCPLCEQQVMAQIEVEVRLGPLQVSSVIREPGSGEPGAVAVDVQSRPRLRALKVEHECRAERLEGAGEPETGASAPSEEDAGHAAQKVAGEDNTEGERNGE